MGSLARKSTGMMPAIISPAFSDKVGYAPQTFRAYSRCPVWMSLAYYGISSAFSEMGETCNIVALTTSVMEFLRCCLGPRMLGSRLVSDFVIPAVF